MEVLRRELQTIPVKKKNGKHHKKLIWLSRKCSEFSFLPFQIGRKEKQVTEEIQKKVRIESCGLKTKTQNELYLMNEAKRYLQIYSE